MSFKGFPEGKTRQILVPETFFHELLTAIDHLGELKLILYFFWRLNRMEGQFRYLTRADFVKDSRFMLGLRANPQGAEPALDLALKQALDRGTLLKAEISRGQGNEDLYYLNSAKGRAAVEAIARGEWRYTEETRVEVTLGEEQKNIFEL